MSRGTGSKERLKTLILVLLSGERHLSWQRKSIQTNVSMHQRYRNRWILLLATQAVGWHLLDVALEASPCPNDLQAQLEVTNSGMFPNRNDFFLVYLLTPGGIYLARASSDSSITSSKDQ